MALRELFFRVSFDVDSKALEKANKAVEELNENLTGKAAQNFDKNLNQVDAAAEKMTSRLGKAAGAAGRAAASIAKLATPKGFAAGMKRVGSGISNVVHEAAEMDSGLGKAARASIKVSNGLGKVGRAAGKVAGGMGKAAGAAGKAAGAIGKVAAVGGQAALSLGKVAAASGAVAASAAALSGIKLAKDMIGGAAELELQQLQMRALVGDAKQADILFEKMNKRGAISVFSETDFIQGAKAFLPMVRELSEEKRVPMVDQLTALQERLAASNKDQGMEGAAYAIREALGGDTLSLQDRFDVPKSMLTALKQSKNVEQSAAALDKILNQMGYTQEYLDIVGGSASAMWDNMQSNAESAMKKAGGAALEALKPVMKNVNEFLGSGGADSFFNAFGKGLAAVITAGAEFVGFMMKNWPKVQKIIGTVGNAVRPVFNQIRESIKTVASVVKSSIPAIAPVFRTMGTTIKNNFAVLQPLFGAFRNIVSAIGRIAPPIFQALGRAWEVVGPVITNAVSQVSGIISSFVNNVVVPLMPYARNIIVDAITKATQIYEKMDPIITAVGNVFKWLVNDVVSPLVPTIGTTIEKMWEIAKIPLNLLEMAIDAISAAIEKTIEWAGKFKDTMDRVKNMEIGLPEWLGGEGLIQMPAAGSHETGLRRVPYDGYLAELHKGERVLTAAESRAYNRLEAGLMANSQASTAPESWNLTPEAAPGYSRSYSDNSSNFNPTINLYTRGGSQGGGGMRQDIFTALDEYWSSMGRRIPRVTEG